VLLGLRQERQGHRALVVMSRIVYCRYTDCQVGTPCIAGKLPPVCPGCERPGRWTTRTPPPSGSATNGAVASDLDLTYNDLEMLRRHQRWCDELAAQAARR
jgi:hypothetical protein